jgi:isocitrate/isopropylmalate dehydrogenase
MAHGRAILLGLRRGLDLYVNHRPIELPGATVDLYRENTQGLYAGVGGTTGGTALDVCVYTRPAVVRFVRYCLRDLHRKGRRTVTLVHKANAVPNTGALWQDVFRTELAAVPDLTGTEEYVDSFCYHLVRVASRYEAVLTENLFGDIASDVGAALMGGLGVAASASVCPETGFGLFEPVHGSAPDIARTGTANPCAAMASSAMLLDHLRVRRGSQLPTGLPARGRAGPHRDPGPGRNRRHRRLHRNRAGSGRAEAEGTWLRK